ncbi:MAG: hypothetical protein BGO77_03295 [Caedibacter sp. 37-49]|nr:MAG: hypothetical protein BGO77_03295 [Caedibacter sp. 37-49]
MSFDKMKWSLRKWFPTTKKFQKNALLKKLSRFEKESIARGVAIGLFINFLPIPFQALWASLLCVYFKANLPIAVSLSFINNPFTFIPINYFLYKVGTLILGEPSKSFSFPEFRFDLGHFLTSLEFFKEWALGLGKPYLLGIFVVSLSTSTLGYLLIQAFWAILRKYSCTPLERMK